jgi:hypothetical protein
MGRKHRKPQELPTWTSFDWLTNSAGLMGTFMASGKGTGKSRGVVRDLVWKRFLRGIGQVYLDPVGAGALNFVDKLLRFSARLPRHSQKQLWQRVRVLRFSGQNLPGFPLYFRLGQESLYEMAQRFLDVVRRLDPHLQTASVEGWNPLYVTGTNVGMVLASLGLQITEAEDLLLHPRRWKPQLEQALNRDPEVEPAVRYFHEYMEWDARTQARYIASFMNKTRIFTLDPTMRAIFGAEQVSLNLAQVRERGLTVFLDTRGLGDTERKQFVNMWLFQLILSNIKFEGVGRRTPLAFYLDELADIANRSTSGDLLAADIQELADKWARNASVMYFFMSQHLHAQFSDTLVKTLLSSGNLVIGNMSDAYDAQDLAQHLFPYHASRVKHWEPVYSGMPPRVIDWRPQFFSVQEQQAIAVQAFTRLKKFRFLIRPARSEGDVTGQVQTMNLEGLDRNVWVDGERVEPVVDLLAARSGTSQTEQGQQPERRFADKEHPGEPSQSLTEVATAENQEGVMNPGQAIDNSQPRAGDEELDPILLEVLDEMAHGSLEETWQFPFRKVS